MFAPRFILNDQLDLHFHTASLRPSRLPTTVAVVDLSHAGAAGRGARCRESHALRHEIAHRLGVCPSNRSAKLLVGKFSRISGHGEDLS